MLILKTNMTKQEINMAVLENSRRRRAAVKEYREKKRSAKAQLPSCAPVTVWLSSWTG